MPWGAWITAGVALVALAVLAWVHFREATPAPALLNASIEDPDGFWAEAAENCHWYKKWDRFLEYDFKESPEVRYFVGGKILFPSGAGVCHGDRF